MTEPPRLVLVRPPKPKCAPKEFSVPDALARADEILSAPCAGHLPRVPGRGELVARFVLPLDLCQPQNATRHAPVFALAATKEKIWRLLWVQAGCQIRPVPLTGRPQIRAIRFSVKEPDQMNDGFKVAIDQLCVPRAPKQPGGRKKKGLGFLQDDAPRFVRIDTWWEKSRQGYGLGLLEVWTG